MQHSKLREKKQWPAGRLPVTSLWEGAYLGGAWAEHLSFEVADGTERWLILLHYCVSSCTDSRSQLSNHIHTWIVYKVSTNKPQFPYGTDVGTCFSTPPCNFTHGLGLFWIEALQHIFYSRPRTHFQEGIPTVTPHHHLSAESAKVTVPELQQEEHVLNKLISALLSVLARSLGLQAHSLQPPL